MKVAVFSSKPYDKHHFNKHNSGHQLTYFETRLTPVTAPLAANHDVVCCFVNDELSRETLSVLAGLGISIVIMRCAGFNNIDLDAASKFNIKAARVPEYSPYAVAEHAVALVLDLNRNIHRAHNRIRENDYSLNGLLGFDLHGKVVGVIGAGKIGQSFARIMKGFGCKIIAYDPFPNDQMRQFAEFTDLAGLFATADLISLHCPLTDDTYHLINENSIKQMKAGVMLINTSRGGLIDTKAVIQGLKCQQIGYLGLDVYEEEESLFFEDYSNEVLQDDIFARLLTFNNVVITGHQGFFTREALDAIAQITRANLDYIAGNQPDKVHWIPNPAKYRY